MKKLFSVLFVCLCATVFATDLPVPEEVIGKQTVGVVTLDLKALKVDQLIKTFTEKAGTAPDAEATAQVKDVLGKFKAAGGATISLVINADKNAKPEDAADSIVVVVGPSDDADLDKLKAFAAEAAAPVLDKAAKGCPKKIGDMLVWHSAKYKLPKKDETRAGEFSDAFTHLAKGATLAIVIVPDEDAVALAEEGIKSVKPDEAETVKALLSANAYCIFTNLGAVAQPVLNVLVQAADADGAVAIDKAFKKAVGSLKKDAPPPAVKFLNTLKTAQVGSNVQLGIDLNAIAEAIKGVLGAGN